MKRIELKDTSVESLKKREKKLEERKLYFVHLCESYRGLFPRVDPLSDEFEAAFSGLLEAQKELNAVAVELIQIRMKLSSTMHNE